MDTTILEEIAAVAKKHGVSISACSCCDGLGISKRDDNNQYVGGFDMCDFRPDGKWEASTGREYSDEYKKYEGQV